MPRHPADALSEQVGLPVVVVHAIDHRVLKRDAAAGFLKIAVAGGEQLLHVVGVVDRHDAAARRAVRRVERNRKRELQVFLRKRVDAGYNAAGGKRDVAHSDVQPLRVIHELQKAQHVRAVVQRLADAHENDVGDVLSRIQLGKEHLIKHLRRC